MDLEQKVNNALMQAFSAERVELDVNDGISGFVVSNAFRGHESIDRQRMIYDALNEHGLTNQEIRDVIISALTPEEAIGYYVP